MWGREKPVLGWKRLGERAGRNGQFSLGRWVLLFFGATSFRLAFPVEKLIVAHNPCRRDYSMLGDDSHQPQCWLCTKLLMKSPNCLVLSQKGTERIHCHVFLSPLPSPHFRNSHLYLIVIRYPFWLIVHHCLFLIATFIFFQSLDGLSGNAVIFLGTGIRGFLAI